MKGKYALCVVLVVALGLAGCATVSRTVDHVGNIVHAVADTVDILEQPAKDVNDVWESVGLNEEDAAPTAESKSDGE